MYTSIWLTMLMFYRHIYNVNDIKYVASVSLNPLGDPNRPLNSLLMQEMAGTHPWV
jgi:hypothetical protein